MPVTASGRRGGRGGHRGSRAPGLRLMAASPGRLRVTGTSWRDRDSDTGSASASGRSGSGLTRARQAEAAPMPGWPGLGGSVVKWLVGHDRSPGRGPERQLPNCGIRFYY